MTGGVYYVEPGSGVSEAVIALGEVPLADGLELVVEDDASSTLYITQGGENKVSIYTIKDGSTAPEATLLGVLKSDLYDTPATSAVLGDKIYSAMSSSLPIPAPGENNATTFNETFSVVGLSRFVDPMGDSPTPAPSPEGPSSMAANNQKVFAKSMILGGFVGYLNALLAY